MLNNPTTKSRMIAGRSIDISTGKLAKQANGSVLIQSGNTVLLAAATMSKQPKDGIDFFPLTIEFSEKMYASGKIPGGFFKREARPSTNATLTARLIDRPIRPCFPSGMTNEVQVVVTVLSYDDTFPLEHLAITAASAALTVSDIPFNTPVGAAIVGYINGEYVVNPSASQMKDSLLDITVAGTKEAILMIEAGAHEVSEQIIINAVKVAHAAIKEVITIQEDLAAEVGKSKLTVPLGLENPQLTNKIETLIGTKIEDNMQSGSKDEIDAFLTALQEEILAQFVNEDTSESEVKLIFSKVKKAKIRQTIISKKIRPDGRKPDEIRPIETEIGILPIPHGSSLFTRGETQSLCVTTLGSTDDEQIIDGLNESSRSRYYFHYNFPPYSVGECGRIGSTSRRELGHGALAERALASVLPDPMQFPYTIRIVSEILESNGSSSMASVCAGSLSLMHSGVPIKAPVSGIAMGLLMDEQGDYVVLSDIQGLEDHYGDMDFKVAGTKDGITALQLDIKIAGLSEQILTAALEQALQGRLHILEKMSESISSPNKLSDKAPRIVTITINPDKIGMVIGSGGKTIREIEEVSGATVSIGDGNTGEITISAKNNDDVEKAKNFIENLVREIQEGEEFEGKVVNITNFGAFIELIPGKEGLLHISEIATKRLKTVDEALKLNDVVKVTVQSIDPQKRVKLVLSNGKMDIR